MKRGDIVKYSKPVDDEEALLRFVLLREPEKGRADIQLVCDWPFKPIETVAVGEIEVAIGPLTDSVRAFYLVTVVGGC